jgi:hypothetical protein
MRAVRATAHRRVHAARSRAIHWSFGKPPRREVAPIPEGSGPIVSIVYEEYKRLGCKFYVTEKLDGSSATFYYKDGIFGVCSRNLELLETENNTFWKVARELDLENKLRKHGVNISIQGELIGTTMA